MIDNIPGIIKRPQFDKRYFTVAYPVKIEIKNKLEKHPEIKYGLIYKTSPLKLKILILAMEIDSDTIDDLQLKRKQEFIDISIDEVIQGKYKLTVLM